MREPSPAPLTLNLDAKGNTLNLTDFHEKVVLLNLWATWCAPFVREMPSLDRLQAALGSDEFMVLAFSIDRGGLKAVMPFFQQLDLNSLSVFLNPNGKASEPFRVRGLPTSFIIDHLGRIRGELAGPAEWATEKAKALLLCYIGRIGNEIDKTSATDLEEYWNGAKNPAFNVLPMHVMNETAQAT